MSTVVVERGSVTSGLGFVVGDFMAAVGGCLGRRLWRVGRAVVAFEGSFGGEVGDHGEEIQQSWRRLR